MQGIGKHMQLAAVGVAVAISSLIAPSIAWASPSMSTTVFVAPGASPTASGHSCESAAYATIQSAVNAAPVNGTVIACPGTYHESVTITKSLTLDGEDVATIDATGMPYGIGIAASYVTIRDFTVENASDTTDGPADGIITAGFVSGVPVAANNVTINGDMTYNNAGAGIDLNSTSNSIVKNSTANNNGIGINVSDDLGAGSSNNTIINNVASGNPGGCGIVLAEHSGLGIHDNLVRGNIANDNGLGTASAPDASAGSGIIIAGGGGGGVYNNVVDNNTFKGNGHAGVAIHVHSPGLNFSGNVISRNDIGTNNLRTDFADLSTTGIYVGDVDPLTLTVVGNDIHKDQVGIFTAGPVTLNTLRQNDIHNVGVPLQTVAVYAG